MAKVSEKVRRHISVPLITFISQKEWMLRLFQNNLDSVRKEAYNKGWEDGYETGRSGEF
jgi:hypothetical protein